MGTKMWFGLSWPKGLRSASRWCRFGMVSVNASNLRSGVQRSFAHVEERVLHAHAVVRGKLLQQRGKIRVRTCQHNPASLDAYSHVTVARCAEDAIGGRLERGQLVL
jgi:hypothetical protein